MASKKNVEPGLHREHSPKLAPVPGERANESATPVPAKALEQPMLTQEEIADLRRESAETLKQFRRILAKKKD